MLFLRNSLTGENEEFNPIDPSRIRVYACGPTVYGRAHIGNLRAAVTFDLLIRTLRRKYGKDSVVFVRNLTDVDDKITAAARTLFPDLPLNEAIVKVANPAIDDWHRDTKSLGCQSADFEPRATDYIASMQKMISTLIDRGHAYVSDGHVLFAVQSAPELTTGALGRRPDAPEDAMLFSRTGSLSAKRHPQDFVLWKPSGADHPAWPSPWGDGRPGWHIECSAMAKEILGESFDIHAGGRDLMVPHHANEILQSGCSCSGGPKIQAHTWVHTGMLTVNGRKMSKSLGNVISMDTVKGKLAPAAVRLALLSARYRSELDWTDTLVSQYATLWRRLLKAAQGQNIHAKVPDDIGTALLDDLNTPRAIAALIAEMDSGGEGVAAGLDALGLMEADALVFSDENASKKVEALLEARAKARLDKDWATSDAIRDKLVAAGVNVLDEKTGVTWFPSPDFSPDLL